MEQKGTKIPFIPGTKPSIRNSQLLVSTGIVSLDSIIGGGLPIGSMMVLEEDTYGNYAKVMLEYFLAEGVVSSHGIFLASQDSKPSQMISELPAVVQHNNRVDNSLVNDEKMQIAWRYQNMRVKDFTSDEQSFGHFYDLSKKMDKTAIETANITTWNGGDDCLNNNWHKDCKRFTNLYYVDLLKNIQETLNNGNYFVESQVKKRNVVRIGLHSLGSRFWLADDRKDSEADLLRFLYCFRALLRNSYAVSVVTVPVHHFDSQSSFIERIEHMADVAIALESFVGSSKETNPIFRDYHGLFHIKKLSALNTLAAVNPKSYDLAFKMRRKKFVIETLHLPPEFTESTQREQDDSIPFCGGGGGGGSGGSMSRLNF